MKRRLGILGAWFGISFVLHFIWEHAQMSLYELPEMTTWEGIRMCLFATGTGDMLFMLVIYAVIGTVERNAWWPRSPSAYRHFSTWFLAVLLGLLLATSFELWAVYVEERWAYAETMPLVPILKVGVAPFLQMVVVPIAVLAIHRWLNNTASPKPLRGPGGRGIA